MRVPQPFYRSQTSSWYLQLGKKQINLGNDETLAWRKYHEIMAGLRDVAADDSCVRIIDEFLEWTKNNREASTYNWYLPILQSFSETIGNLKVSELKPYHVTRWQSGHHAIRCVQRAFNWAVRQGHIERSPVANMEKPTLIPRDTIITPEQFTLLFNKIKDQEFRDFVTVLWETGCRPKEVRIVEAKHIVNKTWFFEIKKSKGKRKHRIVHLTPNALAITQRLMQLHPTGPLFRNTKSNPWTKNAIGLRFDNLSDKLGFPVTAYVFRHSWATLALKRGVDPVTVATLMGHSDTRMLERVYQHLGKDDAHLQTGLLRATGVNVSVPLVPESFQGQ
jgi:integrase